MQQELSNERSWSRLGHFVFDSMEGGSPTFEDRGRGRNAEDRDEIWRACYCPGDGGRTLCQLMSLHGEKRSFGGTIM